VKSIVFEMTFQFWGEFLLLVGLPNPPPMLPDLAIWWEHDSWGWQKSAPKLKGTLSSYYFRLIGDRSGVELLVH